jgi:hypothetical protein
MTLLTARNEDGQALAVALVVIDDSVCLIQWAASTSHEARWALHHHLVELLIARGVRYLLAAGGGTFGALGFETPVQHYQHLLGYELRHLTAARAQAAARRPRLVVALVAVAGAMALLLAPRALARVEPIRAPHARIQQMSPGARSAPGPAPSASSSRR